MRSPCPLALLGLALACAPAQAPIRSAPPPVTIGPPPATRDADEDEARRIDPVLAAASYLDGGLGTRFARPAFFDAIFAAQPGASAGGDALAAPERQPAGTGVELAVVEEREAAVRALIEDDGVRLVAYLPRRDLHPVLRHRARAWLGGVNDPISEGRCGVWLRPGLIASDRGRLRRVELDDALWRGSAWIDRRAVDRVYEPELSWRDDFAPVAGLHAGQAITTRSGTILATVPAGTTIGVEERVRVGELSRVRYESEHLVVEGFVPTAALDHGNAPQPQRYGTGSTGGWGTGGPHRYLHEGDLLHDRPGGEVIGVVTGERVLFAEHDADADGLTVAANLRGWGFAALWIPTRVVQRSDAWEATYELRVRIEPKAGGAALPRDLTIRHGSAARCWSQELAAGASQPLDVSLEWATSGHVAILGPASIGEGLRACLERAFRMSHPSGLAAPLPFTLSLAPLALPPP
jgi:hypothetical protein